MEYLMFSSALSVLRTHTSL